MTRINCRKPGPTARARRAKAAKDRRLASAVRVEVDKRDGYCRIANWEDNPDDWHCGRLTGDGFPADGCDGKSEWAHWDERKRFKTRGLPPEERHNTQGTLMLCTKHHDQYDGRRFPKLAITCLTDLGCDGPLRLEIVP